MSKLITLKDNKTSEYIYPTTSTKLIIDDNGNNVLEFVENSIYEVKLYVKKEITNIKQIGESIKNLEGRKSSTKDELIISKNITQVELNKNHITEIDNLSDKILDRVQKIKLDQNIYNELNVIDVLNYLNETTSFIEYGTPTTSPTRKRIMVDDNNLYIGLGEKWYVIKLDK